MVKQKSSKRFKKSGIEKFVKKHQALSALAILLAGLSVAGTIAVVNQQLQAHFERAKFLHAKTDLAQIYKQIVITVGEPETHQATQSCSYTSVEHKEGSSICSVTESFEFSPSKAQSLLSMAEEIQQALEQNRRARSVNRDVVNFGDKNTILSSSFSLQSIEHCSSSYSHVASEATALNSNVPSTEKLNVVLSCDMSAKAGYFPAITK